MIIFKKSADLRRHLSGQSQPVAFVPTMGALHAGHRSLLDLAREDGCYTVVSVFVNPTQFNDPEDFRKYPTTPEADALLLEEAGCDCLFMPGVADVYPGGAEQIAAYDFGYLETVLEGAHRAGHFRGVGQVVGRLLEIVQPARLYMGEKDFQQCMVVASLLKQMPGGEKTVLVLGRTVREDDGLAMSSRNRRLSAPQRALAGLIYQCLVSIASKQSLASFEIVRHECGQLLTAKGFTPEYIALADADTLELLNEYDAARNTVALIAARLGNIRLIDNMRISGEGAAMAPASHDSVKELSL